MLELCEQLALIDDGVDRLLVDDARLGHLLHCVELLWVLATGDFPDLAEATAPNHILEVEVVLSDGYKN